MSKVRQSRVSPFSISSETECGNSLLIQPTVSAEVGILSERCASNNLKVLADKILNIKDTRSISTEGKRKINDRKYDEGPTCKKEENKSTLILSSRALQSVLNSQSKAMSEKAHKMATEIKNTYTVLSCQSKRIIPKKAEITKKYYSDFIDINSSQSDCELSNTTSKTQATSNLSQNISMQKKTKPDYKCISLGPSGLFQLDEARQNTDSKTIEEGGREESGREEGEREESGREEGGREEGGREEGSREEGGGEEGGWEEGGKEEGSRVEGVREDGGLMQFVDIQKQSSTFSTMTHHAPNSNNPDERMMRAPETLRSLVKEISSNIVGPHRMNACGALKCICLIPQNRYRLAHTQGVVSIIVNMVCSQNAVRPEKIRCMHALIYLSKEKCNHEVILRDENIRNRLGNFLLKSTDSQICKMISYCMSLLALNGINRERIIENKIMMQALENIISKNEPIEEIMRCNGVFKSSCEETIGTFHATQMNSLTIILSLSREPNIAPILCQQTSLMNHLIELTNSHDQKIAICRLCIAIFANISRHRNNMLLNDCQVNNFISMVLKVMQIECSESREYACYVIQNLSCHEARRDEICRSTGKDNDINTDESQNVLESLGKCAARFGNPKEQLAAMNALRNLAQGASNFVHFMGSNGVIETLLQVSTSGAQDLNNSVNINDIYQNFKCPKNHDDCNHQNTHVDTYSSIIDELRYVACDIVATIALFTMTYAIKSANLKSNEDEPLNQTEKNEAMVKVINSTLPVSGLSQNSTENVLNNNDLLDGSAGVIYNKRLRVVDWNMWK